MKRPADAYRIVRAEDDPDLPLPPSVKAPGAFSRTKTHREFDRAMAQVKSAGGRADRLLTIACFPHGCGEAKNRGAVLASVYRTDAGILYVADITLDHGYGDRQRHEAGLKWVVMRHPITEGIAEVTKQSFDAVWASKGWELAPPDTEPPARWEPRYMVRVRDLLDRDDLEHAPLRCQCPKRGEVMLDRDLVLGEVHKAKRARARRVVISDVLAVD